MAAEEKKQTQKDATISQLTVKICTIREIYGALEVLFFHPCCETNHQWRPKMPKMS